MKITTEKHKVKLRSEKVKVVEVIDYEDPKNKKNPKKDEKGIPQTKKEKITLFKEDSIPQSHTCDFCFEPPLYSSMETFKQ